MSAFEQGIFGRQFVKGFDGDVTIDLGLRILLFLKYDFDE